MATDDMRTILKSGDDFAKAGDLPRAIERYATAADIFLSGPNPMKAVALYKMILELDPTRTEFRPKLAAAYARLGLPPETSGTKRE